MKSFALEGVRRPEYHISMSPHNNGDFIDQLNSLVNQYDQVINELGLRTDSLVFAKIFLCDYINQKPLIDNHPKFASIFENSITSVIEQYPLDGTKINLLLYFVKTDDILIKKNQDTYSVQLDGYLHLYQIVSQYGKDFDTPYKQTNEAFDNHIKVLSENNMTLQGNCVRTWLYSRDVDKDYAEIVKARNDIFAEEGLTVDTHFITSTGIEGKGLNRNSSVNADFYSIKGIKDEQIQYLQALEYLNNTYEYGVAFERGVSISYLDKKHIFISGTASIDKTGECLFRNDVLKQVERIFVNINMLLKNTDAYLSDIAQMIVYLRNVSDYPIISHYLEEFYANVPKVIVLARVCRPEWLIEIECIATKQL